jgi:5-methylcytosine-specific restriction endonuclease McrA
MRKKAETKVCKNCKQLLPRSDFREHKTPLSRGGSNDYENLGIACKRCNGSKRDKTVNEYIEYLNKKGVKK